VRRILEVSGYHCPFSSLPCGIDFGIDVYRTHASPFGGFEAQRTVLEDNTLRGTHPHFLGGEQEAVGSRLAVGHIFLCYYHTEEVGIPTISRLR